MMMYSAIYYGIIILLGLANFALLCWVIHNARMFPPEEEE